MRPITVPDAVDAFLADVARSVSANTLAAYRAQLGKFASFFVYEIASNLTPAKVRRWGGSFHQLQPVRRLTRWLVTEARLLERDPLEGMSIGRVGRRLRTLAPAESARLLRRSRPALRRFVLALGESIARPHELRAVTWRDVRIAGLQPFEVKDLENGDAFFFLDRFKAQARRRDHHAVRVIPITPRLGRLLARLWREKPNLDAAIFQNERRRPWSINAVRCAFRRLRVRAGIAVDARGENVVAYTLRHTAATAAIVAGVEVGQLAGAMGHSDIRQTMRYVHLSPAFLSSVVHRVHRAKLARRRKNDLPGLRRTRPDDRG